MINIPGFDFKKENRIAEIHKNIKSNQEKISDRQNNIASVNILEQEVELEGGEKMVLFSIEGSEKEGLAVTPQELEDGVITREDICKALCGVE